MLISFKLKDYDEICEVNEYVLSRSVIAAIGIGRNERLEIMDYRIQIPALNLVARQGYVSEKGGDGWFPEDDMFAIYAPDCEYLSEYLCFCCADLGTTVYEYCRRNNIPVEAIPELECIIDTDEFLSPDGKVKKTKKYRRGAKT